LSDEDNEPAVKSKVPLPTQPAHLPSHVSTTTDSTDSSMDISYENETGIENILSTHVHVLEKYALL